MAQLKHCTECNKTKSTSEFHRKTASKDGLQSKCKTCVKQINKNFRETKPKYQITWQRQNSKKHIEIVTRFRRADKSSKVYYIKCNVTGLYYIGMTKMHLPVRWIEHKTKFNRWMRGKKTTQHPNLFQSFKTYGINNHEVGILFESEDLDRKTLRMYERTFIKTFMDLGLALNHKI